MSIDSFSSRSRIAVAGSQVELYRLDALARAGVGDVATLPYSLRILAENLLRCEDGTTVRADDIAAVAGWAAAGAEHEVQLRPARVLMQDFSGVAALCDLAAMRDAVVELGLPAAAIDPEKPVDLVIDHSLQVDEAGSPEAHAHNLELDYQRNLERYRFLRWSQRAFANLRVVPPGAGICHQVNLEYLARVVTTEVRDGTLVAFPDSVIGTDSHTTMVNALGVFGWGVGGIEAEAVMLGQPMAMRIPEVVGVELTGELPAGTTATDLVLTLTQLLRRRGVVDKFVEFTGPGVAALAIPDRATIANMAPEYGATMALFPVDDETLAYLRFTGRADDHVQLVERYAKDNLMWRDPTIRPRFTDTVALDLSSIEPSLAGPSRPHDRIPLRASRAAWRRAVPGLLGERGGAPRAIDAGADGAGPSPGQLAASRVVASPRGRFTLGHGAVVIAAITSCTNTSNPSVMVAAGLVARAAVARGLRTKPWVKTSLAPGSQVVVDYLAAAALTADLEVLGFHLVGFGCTTCVGNSGPLDPSIAAAIEGGDLVVASVLSGNRNFEGRVHPLVRASYLASPPLVVAHALAGTVDLDFAREPIGRGSDGAPVYLRELWPSPAEIARAMRAAIHRDQYVRRYAHILEGDDRWRALDAPGGDRFAWDDASTYLRRPGHVDHLAATPAPLADITGARILAILGDAVTTDHISPVGTIAAHSPAARYLDDLGVAPADYNQYGARRGNPEVMVRGTFASTRLKNRMVAGIEGGYTRHVSAAGATSPLAIYDAAMAYARHAVPLVVIAGELYGSGSARDWAAKGTALLGVRAVIARSFERIHRANLVGMGVLPLQFQPGEDAVALGLTGEEEVAITGIAAGVTPRMPLRVRAGARAFTVIARVDTAQEADYIFHGGILPYVLRQRARQRA